VELFPRPRSKGSMSFGQYAERYADNWIDPKLESANKTFLELFHQRGLGEKWIDAKTPEQEAAVLQEWKELERECGLQEPEPAQPQPSLTERIRLE
jgi:hypothetical protein